MVVFPTCVFDDVRWTQKHQGSIELSEFETWPMLHGAVNNHTQIWIAANVTSVKSIFLYIDLNKSI